MLVLRDISYFYYILAVSAHAMFQASIHGFAFHLWPEFPILNQYAVPDCTVAVWHDHAHFYNSFSAPARITPGDAPCPGGYSRSA